MRGVRVRTHRRRIPGTSRSTTVRHHTRVIPSKVTARNVREGESFYGIRNTTQSHWGLGQTGVGLAEDGRFAVSRNIPDEGEFPTHRHLAYPYAAIYSYGYDDDPPTGTIWLYPDAEKNLDQLKPALRNMKGSYGITKDTKIKSNITRTMLGTIGSI